MGLTAIVFRPDSDGLVKTETGEATGAGRRAGGMTGATRTTPRSTLGNHLSPAELELDASESEARSLTLASYLPRRLNALDLSQLASIL